MQLSKAALILTLCLLVGLAFTTGFLLLEERKPPAPVTDTASQPDVAATPILTPATPAPAPEPPPAPADIALTSGGRGRGTNMGVIAPKPTWEGGICSFDAAVYDVRINADQITRLDVDALEKAAATREEFEKALAALGTARPLYRSTQAISLGEEHYFMLNNTMPDANVVVPAPPPTRRGVIVKNDKSTGAVFDILAKGREGGMLNIMMSVNATIVIEGPTTGAVTINTPVIRTASMMLQRDVAPNKPLLFVSADAANLDANGKAVVFLARVIIGPPQFPATTLPALAPPAPRTERQ